MTDEMVDSQSGLRRLPRVKGEPFHQPTVAPRLSDSLDLAIPLTPSQQSCFQNFPNGHVRKNFPNGHVRKNFPLGNQKPAHVVNCCLFSFVAAAVVASALVGTFAIASASTLLTETAPASIPFPADHFDC